MSCARRAFVALSISSVLFSSSVSFARDGEGRDDIQRQIQGDNAQEVPPPEPITSGSSWRMGIFGYLRGGYENVQKDKNRPYVGRNSGFILDSARLGFEGRNEPYHTSFRLSIEAASDSETAVNTPQGSLETRMRDAFIRTDPVAYVGVQVGQFRVPFSEEDLRGVTDLLFASRAVAQTGVMVGRGDQVTGLGIDREIGVMLSPEKPITIAGPVGVAYYLSLFNGNGANQLLNDSNDLAFAGRVEAVYGKLFQLGGAFLYNPRSRGVQPYAFVEKDMQFSGDVKLTFKGLEVAGQFTQRSTKFETVKTDDRKQIGWHAQVGYKIPIYVPVMPAYRIAAFDPWSNAKSGSAVDKQALLYHTFGVRVFHPKLPLSTYINYTITNEEKPNRLNNNRLEILAQLLF
ncbi:MAG: porin [Polyangiaceae bacterium]